MLTVIAGKPYIAVGILWSSLASHPSDSGSHSSTLKYQSPNIVVVITRSDLKSRPCMVWYVLVWYGRVGYEDHHGHLSKGSTPPVPPKARTRPLTKAIPNLSQCYSQFPNVFGPIGKFLLNWGDMRRSLPSSWRAHCASISLLSEVQVDIIL